MWLLNNLLKFRAKKSIKSFFKLFLIVSLVVQVHSVIAEDDAERGSDLDIMVLGLSADVQDYVLYLQMLDDKNAELYDSLTSGLETKLFNLTHHLSRVENRRVISAVCQMSKNMKEQLIEISGSCKSNGETSICEQAYNLSMMCVSKNNNSLRK